MRASAILVIHRHAVAPVAVLFAAYSAAYDERRPFRQRRGWHIGEEHGGVGSYTYAVMRSRERSPAERQ